MFADDRWMYSVIDRRWAVVWRCKHWIAQMFRWLSRNVSVS